jgi:hypothetical protein
MDKTDIDGGSFTLTIPEGYSEQRTIDFTTPTPSSTHEVVLYITSEMGMARRAVRGHLRYAAQAGG